MRLRGAWWVLAMASMLVACAEQRIRTQADDQRRAGQFEQAVQTLEAGLKDQPESAPLRASLAQTRSDALAQLLSAAMNARAAGKLDEAQALLQRAEALEGPGGRSAAL